MIRVLKDSTCLLVGVEAALSVTEKAKGGVLLPDWSTHISADIWTLVQGYSRCVCSSGTPESSKRSLGNRFFIMRVRGSVVWRCIEQPVVPEIAHHSIRE